MTEDEALKILELTKEAKWEDIRGKTYNMFHDKMRWESDESAELDKIFFDESPEISSQFVKLYTAYEVLYETHKKQEKYTSEDTKISKIIEMAKKRNSANTEYSNALNEAKNQISGIEQDGKVERISCTEKDCKKSYIGNIDEFGKQGDNNSKYYWPHGYGTKKDENGDEYTGTIIQNKRSGLGKLTTGDGKVYTGFFKDEIIGMHVMVEGHQITYKNGDLTITDKFLIKRLKKSLENDVNVYVKKAQDMIKTFKREEETQKTKAEQDFKNAINNAKQGFPQTYGYIFDNKTESTYYGGVKTFDGEWVANGIGYKEYKKINTYKNKTEIYEIDSGTFVNGQFTFGKKTHVSTNLSYANHIYEYGFFENGKLTGWGSKDGVTLKLHGSQYMRTKKYSDSFETENVDKPFCMGYSYKIVYDGWTKGIIKDYAFLKCTATEESIATPGTEFETGTNYNLVQQIKEKMIKEVDKYEIQAIKVRELAKQTQDADIEKAKQTEEIKRQTHEKNEKEKDRLKIEEQLDVATKTKIDNANTTYKDQIEEIKKVAEVRIQKYGTFKFDNDDTYLGGIDSTNKPYGVGTLTFKNEDMYQGSFTNHNMKFGKITYKDGSVYQGVFKDGKPHGWGVLISKDYKTEKYSDSFDGKEPGKSLDEDLDAYIKQVTPKKDSTALTTTSTALTTTSTALTTSSTALVVVDTNVENLKALKGKLFGKDLFLVKEIQTNIKDDVNMVVATASTATLQANLDLETERLEKETLEKETLEKDRLENERLEKIISERTQLLLAHGQNVLLTPNNNNNDDLQPLQPFIKEQKTKLRIGESNPISSDQLSDFLSQIPHNYMAIVDNSQLSYKGSNEIVINNDKKTKTDTTEVVVVPLDPNIIQKYEDIRKSKNTGTKQLLLSSNAKSAENKIIFYQDCNYKGNAWSVEDGKQTVKDDKISSIRVPAGKQVIIFRHGDTQGLTITKDTPCLTDIKDINGKDFNDKIETVISGDGNGNGNGNGKDGKDDGKDGNGNGTGTSFSKLALISAATAAATAGLYYAYKKYNKSAKKSSDKRSETKRSETKRSETKRSEPKRSETKRSETKRSEPKRSEPKRSEPKRSEPKRSEPRRSAKKRTNKSSETKRSAKRKRRSDISNRSAKKSSATRSEMRRSA
jgi:hypothetical protein